MGEARFVFISDGMGDSENTLIERVWWRLLAANNRVLGASVGTDAGERVCRERAAELVSRVDDAVCNLSSDGRGRWTWTVELDGVHRAQCGHPFARRVDCVRTLALFLAGLRAADTQAGHLRYFASGPSAAVMS